MEVLVGVFLALFLPCAGMSAVFVVYNCLLWYAANNSSNQGGRFPAKVAAEKGLSESELEKLPKISGKELVVGTECAVCLDEIEPEQPAGMVPGCNHGFHLECADTWLSKHPVCPVCRAKLQQQPQTEPPVQQVIIDINMTSPPLPPPPSPQTDDSAAGPALW